MTEPLDDARGASPIRWSRVNGEPFEYAIQQGPHGDEFVKLLDGSCLRRAPAARCDAESERAVIPKGMKPIYVKRWRTLIFVGESIADEVRAALVPPPSEAGRISDLTKLAAECHRTKWQFDLNEDYQPSKSAARGLITKAFEELHRIGDIAMKMRDEARALSPDPGTVAVASAERCTMCGGTGKHRAGCINDYSLSSTDRGGAA